MLEKWVTGVLINLSGNLCINMGANSIKYHHAATRRQRRNEHQHAQQCDSSSPCATRCNSCHFSLTHSRWWYIGWTIFSLGNLANFISLPLAPQSLLAGLGSSQFLMNSLCEWYFNGRRITARMVNATMLIVIGNTLIVAFAAHDSPMLSVDDIFRLLFEPAFDIYVVVLLFLTLILQIYYNETSKIQQQMVLRRVANLPPVPVAPWRLQMLPFSYAAVSAIIGTQSVWLAKVTSDLIMTSIVGQQQFTQAFTWVILVCWISTIVFWLYRMETALRLFDGPFIIPILQSVWTTFSIVGGGIFFQEFKRMSQIAIIWFVLGVCAMLMGIYLLAPGAHHQSHEEVHQSSSLDASSEVEMTRDAVAGIRISNSSRSSGEDAKSMSSENPHVVMVNNPVSANITRVASTGRMLIRNQRSPNRISKLFGMSSSSSMELSPQFYPLEASPESLQGESALVDPHQLRLDMPVSIHTDGSDIGGSENNRHPHSATTNSQASGANTYGSPHQMESSIALPQVADHKYFDTLSFPHDSISAAPSLAAATATVLAGAEQPHQGRRRAMSFGFSMPLVESEEEDDQV